MNSSDGASVWLAAEFTFAATYSIREAVTSATFARACPVPETGTVKLALIKVAVELYGEMKTKQDLFPIIRDMDISIRPPSHIGVSGQFLRAFKNKSLNNGEVEYSISNREHLHTSGQLIIYYRILEKNQNVIKTLSQAIGYWGQGNSLTYCLSVGILKPELGECITRLETITPQGLKDYQLCYLTDIDSNATWDDVITGKGTFLSLYVLPLKLDEQKRNGKVLKYKPIPR
jgi:hypothetical protein